MAMLPGGNRYKLLVEKERQKGLDRRHEGSGERFLSSLGQTVLDLGKTLGTEYFKWKVGGGEEAHEIDEGKLGVLEAEADTKAAEQKAKADTQKSQMQLTRILAGVDPVPGAAPPAPPKGGADLVAQAAAGEKPAPREKGRRDIEITQNANGTFSLRIGGKVHETYDDMITAKKEERRIKSKQAGQPSAVASIKAKTDKAQLKATQEESAARKELLAQLEANLAEQEVLSKKPNSVANRAKMKVLKAEAARLGRSAGAKSGFNKKHNLQDMTKMKASYFGRRPNATHMARVLNKALIGRPGAGAVTAANAEEFFATLTWNAANSTNADEMKEAQEILATVEQIREFPGSLDEDEAGVDKKVTSDIGSGKAP